MSQDASSLRSLVKVTFLDGLDLALNRSVNYDLFNLLICLKHLILCADKFSLLLVQFFISELDALKVVNYLIELDFLELNF